MVRARFFRSTISRIAIALMGVQLVSVSVTLLMLSQATENSLTLESRELVRELRLDLTDAFKRGGRGAVLRSIQQRLSALDRRDIVISLRDADRKVLAGNLAEWPAGPARNAGWHWVNLRRLGGIRHPMGIEVAVLADGSQLIAGDALEDERRALDVGRKNLFIMFFLGMLLSAVSSWFLARYIGRKIDRISGASARFAEGDLAARAPLDGSNDSFDRLSGGINTMMGRLQTVIGELRLVTDSLAHDLRSPIARVRARLEQAYSASGSSVAAEKVAASIEECDRLDRMLATALQISRAEAGLGRDQFQQFKVGEMLDNLAELYEPLAEEEGFKITRSGEPDVNILAHRELLGQAIGNLVDNAIKHAKGADTIEIGFSAKRHGIEIFVADNGAGIAESEREAAIKRFGRLDSARQTGGAGLGLALVSTVAHLHGGSFELRDNAPGLLAVLAFPNAITEPR